MNRTSISGRRSTSDAARVGPLVPGVSVQLGTVVWDLQAFFGSTWIAVPLLVMVLGLTGTIALTRAFVKLGGSVLPTRPRVPLEERS